MSVKATMRVGTKTVVGVQPYRLAATVYQSLQRRLMNSKLAGKSTVPVKSSSRVVWKQHLIVSSAAHRAAVLARAQLGSKGVTLPAAVQPELLIWPWMQPSVKRLFTSGNVVPS
jgi:hypothetical protein